MARVGQRNLEKSFINIPALRTQTPKTITDRIRELAREDPLKPAFVFRTPGQPRLTLTRQEIVDEAEIMGKHFLNLGIKPGDRIATLVSTGKDWLTVQFGLYMVGAVAVNSPSFILDEFNDIAKKLNCFGTVVENGTSGESGALKFHYLYNGALHLSDVKLTHNHINSDDEFQWPEISPDSEVLMVPTSGSSGVPKLVVHTHESILRGSFSFAEILKISSVDTYTLDRPMTWLGGYPIFYLGSGCTMVYVISKPDSDEDTGFFVETMIEEKATVALLMTYRLKSIIKMKASGKKIPQFAQCNTGGQRISQETASELMSVCKQAMVGYASTECVQCFAHQLNKSQIFKEGTAGYAAFGCEIKIVNDIGDIVEIGEEGELCIRSRACCKDYVYFDGTRAASLDKDGWYHTGDVCICQPDGMIIVRGRKTEMIKRGTVKIFPSHVEKKLREVIDVAEVVVVAIPHPILHQDVCAFIVPKPDTPISEANVRKRANDIFQPSLSPDGFGYMPGHFLVVDNLPVTKSGKWDKVAMVDMALSKIKSS